MKITLRIILTVALGLMIAIPSFSVFKAADEKNMTQAGVSASTNPNSDPPQAGDSAKGIAHGKKSSETATPDKGIGPIKEVKLGPLNDTLAAKGKQIFTQKCTVCHLLNKKKIGPPLHNITNVETPEFIMNMILNADEMEKKDPKVKKLVSQLQTYMSVSDLTEADARAVLEYLRSEADTTGTK